MRNPMLPATASWLSLLFALCLLLAPGFSGTAAADGDLTPLVFHTKSGPVRFEVEVADTPEERSIGLMYRRTLERNRGMLFDFRADTEVAMWMKNTYIPLDMVFVGNDGTVHRVEADTQPFSEQIIPAGTPVRYVIELPAGTAAREKIGRGDRVEHPAIRPPG